jgi:hypothetical protein
LIVISDWGMKDSQYGRGKAGFAVANVEMK